MASLEQRLARLSATLGKRACPDEAHEQRPARHIDYRQCIAPLVYGAPQVEPARCPSCGVTVGIPIRAVQ